MKWPRKKTNIQSRFSNYDIALQQLIERKGARRGGGAEEGREQRNQKEERELLKEYRQRTGSVQAAYRQSVQAEYMQHKT